MEKQKRWHSVLIVFVVILTLYNILPTVLYYAKPLKSLIGEKQAIEIAYEDVKRVNSLENEAISWIHSFCHLLKVKPSKVTISPDNPEFVQVQFIKSEDATKFHHLLPRAGSLISFIPAQLTISHSNVPSDKIVEVQRRIPIQFAKEDVKKDFTFSAKRDAEGNIAPFYREIIDDRMLELGLALGGISENAALVETVLSQPDAPRTEEFLLMLAKRIQSYSQVFGEQALTTKRFYKTFTQSFSKNKSQQIERLTALLNQYKDRLRLERIHIEKEEADLKKEGNYLESIKQQRLDFIVQREKILGNASQVIKRNSSTFASGPTPWNMTTLKSTIRSTASEGPLQVVKTGDRNPLVATMNLNWVDETLTLELHPDVISLKEKLAKEGSSYQKDQLDQLIYNEIAHLSRESGEKISPAHMAFQIKLSDLENSQSFLALNLGSLAKKQAEQIATHIKKTWQPAHQDLKAENFPILDYATYSQLPESEKRLGLIVYAPAVSKEAPIQGTHPGSIYIIAKGFDHLIKRASASPNSPQTQALNQDFNALNRILQSSGFTGYSGSTFPLSASFAGDYIFEAEDFYQYSLKATREDYAVHGTKRYATLEFTDLEQRLLTMNRIETAMHEDLLKWRDEYNAAQVNPEPARKYDVPKPTRSPLLNNLALSFAKYFRGDERKILHWGLDLSGGKTVQIELRDTSGRVVSDAADIKQGINELYQRVNKMGVSEVSIRQEGSTITLDFPSAQGISAQDLVKASSMQFHIVNEKFGLNNPMLADTVSQFLQEVWNEAVVTGKKDVDSINAIAWRHLYGEGGESDQIEPMSEAGKTLYQQGLRLAAPEGSPSTHAFNDALSKIAIFRGDSYTDWDGQTNPLIFVFKNYALEGANLSNVHASYDTTKGNFLAFEVKSSQTLKDGQKISPRSDLYTWTSPFAKENLGGTTNETYSAGRGWRMAIILNGSIISAPALESPLRDNVQVTGSFTQREANRLEADLKAGSLTYSPFILSEKNVSPELGTKDRIQGFIALTVALILVIAVMLGYYRFAGFIASLAVLFNLLIIWATLQNIQATLTLAGIAGVILAVGMAVDANVLVFERIREEYSVSQRIASAIRTGYKKAFSAIIDSNITTIIAALILLNFDAGPIKGFAVTLIIGIVSSMFTALFMTRFFFTKWVAKNKERKLNMASLFKRASQINFLKYGKLTILSSLLVIAVGLALLVYQKKTILGMDFTGGYTISMQVETKGDISPRNALEKALIAQGLTTQEFQTRELSPANNVKILLSRTLDETGKPFYQMPLEYDNPSSKYTYQNNPRIEWIVTALEKEGIQFSDLTLSQLNESWTSISGQMSDTMRNQALLGLSIALLCILVYITIRFEFKYAIGATLGLAFDLSITLGLIAILHAVGVPIQVDLNTIAALMTIIGYSLNDTIVIFDRIREDLHLMRKKSLHEIVNHALNVTLSRTLMTSSTTLVALLPLVIFGGAAIFSLSLVMFIGVIYGTLSSLLIASPIMLFFHKREAEKEGNVAINHQS